MSGNSPCTDTAQPLQVHQTRRLEHGSDFKVSGAGVRISDSEFRTSGLSFQVSGFGF